MSKGTALVTGGAGLIGSHIVDLLVEKGYSVTIFDNLEPQTHRNGKPSWLNPKARFIKGDIRNREDLTSALQGIDYIFHQAAYGGYMPEIEKYVDVNSRGTALLLEIIRNENLPIKKIVVASSQAVYREGSVVCNDPDHPLLQHPETRDQEDLKNGLFEVKCAICSKPTTSTFTPEDAPFGGDTVYALTKIDQEKLVLLWGRQNNVPTVALRYSCTFGPRQSVYNPYTGVIAIFATRILNNLPPIIFEDGLQTRDFSYVKDIARANLLALESADANWQAINIGSGAATTIVDIAKTVATILQSDIVPQISGNYRPGEMRSLMADTTKAKRLLHYEPETSLEVGIGNYISWIKTQGDIKDYFTEALAVYEKNKIVVTAGS
jgi:dTDP-L-rhamnose 4-epimerase